MAFWRFFCLALTFIGLTTCITPANLEPGDFNDLLVVNGFITDEPGPHRVRIDRISRFAGVLQGGATQLEENAQVRILDDLGNTYPLARRVEIVKQISNAVPDGCVPTTNFREALTPSYFTQEGFAGEVGRTYTLEIVTVDNQIYRSEPQTILPTAPVDSLSLRFIEIASLGVPGSAVEIYSSFTDPVGENYYFWQINGIYRLSTKARPGACCLFDPADGLADDCWIMERDVAGNQLALSDRFFEGRHTTQRVGLIEDDGLRFANQDTPERQQYHVEHHLWLRRIW